MKMRKYLSRHATKVLNRLSRPTITVHKRLLQKYTMHFKTNFGLFEHILSWQNEFWNVRTHFGLSVHILNCPDTSWTVRIYFEQSRHTLGCPDLFSKLWHPSFIFLALLFVISNVQHQHSDLGHKLFYRHYLWLHHHLEHHPHNLKGSLCSATAP